jgi:hypothetical protein
VTEHGNQGEGNGELDREVFEQKIDGVAKTPQLLRCAAFFVTVAYHMYASFLRICAPCIWGFLLNHHF